jgi:hypothetical protein
MFGTSAVPAGRGILAGTIGARRVRDLPNVDMRVYLEIACCSNFDQKMINLYAHEDAKSPLN